MAEKTAQRYRRALGELMALAETVRCDREQHATAQKRGGLIGCVCGCGRRIRVARGTLAAGTITRDVCRAAFRPSSGTADTTSPAHQHHTT